MTERSPSRPAGDAVERTSAADDWATTAWEEDIGEPLENAEEAEERL